MRLRRVEAIGVAGGAGGEQVEKVLGRWLGGRAGSHIEEPGGGEHKLDASRVRRTQRYRRAAIGAATTSDTG
jgi:hypothetical protein